MMIFQVTPSGHATQDRHCSDIKSAVVVVVVVVIVVVWCVEWSEDNVTN